MGIVWCVWRVRCVLLVVYVVACVIGWFDVPIRRALPYLAYGVCLVMRNWSNGQATATTNGGIRPPAHAVTYVGRQIPPLSVFADAVLFGFDIAERVEHFGAFERATGRAAQRVVREADELPVED